MEYTERLRQFNSTEKYRREVVFLSSLIGGVSPVLDWGCGTGATMGMLPNEVYGYEPKEYYTGNKRHRPGNRYECAYLMHSLAHIKSPLTTLKSVSGLVNKGGKIIIITPNAEWVNLQNNYNYKPDITVVKHYTLEDLNLLAKEAGLDYFSGQFGEEKDGVCERLFLIGEVA